MADQNLSKIEETLAHQELQIHDLSDMVVRQGDEIAALRKHIMKLEDKIDTIEDDAGGAPAANQKPPHY